MEPSSLHPEEQRRGLTFGIGDEQQEAGRKIDPERDPHQAEERPQRSDRNGAADAEQAQIHHPRAADKQHHSEGVNGENGWKGPDGFRFADPGRQSAVMQRGKKFHGVEEFTNLRIYELSNSQFQFVNS